MGSYVNVVAKKGCAEQINELWSREFSGHLVYTPEIILGEIDYMKNDPQQAYAASNIHTVDDWNANFPIAAANKGQVFIGATNEDIAPEQINALAKQVKWILDHRLLFESITGLDEAREELNMHIDMDAIIHGKNIDYQPLTFNELPKEPNSEIYQHLYQYDRPDLWKNYLDYFENTDLAHWKVLRSNVIPNHDYLAQKTVWQACEDSAKSSSDFPDFDTVTQILIEAVRADIADVDNDRPSM